MATMEQTIAKLKQDYQQASNDKVRIETKLEEAKKRQSEARQKIAAHGYKPKDLEKIIAQKTDELNAVLDEARSYLPSDDEGDDDDEDDDQFDY